MNWQAEALFKGSAMGVVLRLDAPVSFWGGIDPATSEVTLARHPQLGEKIAGKILVVPRLIGSSSSSAILLELLYKQTAPKALILNARDAILPVGILVAQQMGWATIPLLVMPDAPFQTGDRLHLTEGGKIESIP